METEGERGNKKKNPPIETGNTCQNPGKLMGKEKHPML